MDATDPRSDLQLIEAVERGEAAAFEALYYRYRDWVLRLAFRFTGDADAAQDVLQETFLYLLGKFPGFRLTARLTTFLYPAVKNTALRHRARQLRHVPADAAAIETLPYMDPAPAELVQRDLLRTVAALSDLHREVLLMRFVDEMSLGEIAQALAVPLGTVKSRLHHAVACLRADTKVRSFFFDSE